MRNGAARGIGLIFANYAKRLFSSIAPFDGNSRPEMNTASVSRKFHDLSARQTRSPIPDLAQIGCGGASVAFGNSGLMRRFKSIQRGLNGQAPGLGHKIGMWRDRTIGKPDSLVFDFLNESTTHINLPMHDLLRCCSFG